MVARLLRVLPRVLQSPELPLKKATAEKAELWGLCHTVQVWRHPPSGCHLSTGTSQMQNHRTHLLDGLCKEPGPSNITKRSSLRSYSRQTIQILQKGRGIRRQSGARIQCARSLGRFSVPVSIQAQAMHADEPSSVTSHHKLSLSIISIPSLSCPSSHVLIAIPS
jgi:hypothetical protein